MGKDIDRTEQAKAVIVSAFAALDGALDAVQNMSAPGTDAKRIIQTARKEIRSNPKLAEHHSSLINAVMGAAHLGLYPSGVTGQCYLVPYFSKKKGVHECQLVLGYRGMIDVACRAGIVRAINAMPVFKDDKFDFEYGTTQFIRHRPADSDSDGWDTLLMTYAVAYMDNGLCVFRHVGKKRLLALMEAQSRYGGAWESDPIPMAIKTAIRRLFGVLPTVPAMTYQLGREAAMERGEEVPDVEWGEAETPDGVLTKAERVVAALEGKAAAESAAASMAGVSPVTVEDVDAALADGETDDTMF